MSHPVLSFSRSSQEIKQEIKKCINTLEQFSTRFMQAENQVKEFKSFIFIKHRYSIHSDLTFGDRNRVNEKAIEYAEHSKLSKYYLFLEHLESCIVRCPSSKENNDIIINQILPLLGEVQSCLHRMNIDYVTVLNEDYKKSTREKAIAIWDFATSMRPIFL